VNPNSDNIQDDPAVIKREVVETQDEIGDTVEKLSEKLNPREVARAAVGSDSAELAKEALEVTKQSPIPVALIAVGTVWLLATSRAPMIRRVRERLIGSARNRGFRPALALGRAGADRPLIPSWRNLRPAPQARVALRRTGGRPWPAFRFPAKAHSRLPGTAV
jgi:hypothetical protein